MAATFDTYRAVERLASAGVPQGQAVAHVEVIRDTTKELVTRDILKADLGEFKGELYRALWQQVGVIIAAVGVIVTIATAVVALAG